MPVSTYTLLDVLNVIGFRVADWKANIDTVENAEISTVNMIECVNDVLRDLNRVKPLPSRNARTTVSTIDKYDTGTVTVTSGSADVTGSGTTWTADMVGRAFSTLAKPGLYRIVAFTSATSITLDHTWIGDTESAQAYVIAQDRYSLPDDFFDFVGKPSIGGPSTRTLEVKRASEIDQQRYSMKIKPLSTGMPTMASVFDRATSGEWQIEFDPFPDKAYQVAIRYRKMTERVRHDGDIIPLLDDSIDFLYSGVRALWKSITTPEMANAYELWKQTTLPYFASFDQRTTDEATRIVPDNVMRPDRPRTTLYDTTG